MFILEQIEWSSLWVPLLPKDWKKSQNSTGRVLQGGRDTL